MLGKLWAGSMLLAVALVFSQAALGDVEAPQRLVLALFSQSAEAVAVSIRLLGTLAFWMGLFALAEAAGLAGALGRLISPLMVRLMPGVPADHAAMGPIGLNLAANMLGLDNAATPAGLKAMQELQKLNPEPDRLSHAQAMFVVLNAGSVTLLPVSVLMYRAQAGSTDPALVFLPLMLVSLGASLVGVLAALICQGTHAWRDPYLLAVVAGLGAFAGCLGFVLWHHSAAQVSAVSSLLGNGLLLAALAAIFIAAWRRQVALLPVFVEGAKEGLAVSLRIFPYLLAMLTAVGMLRASGMLDALIGGLRLLFGQAAFFDALPTGIMKTFSGSAARGLLLDTFQKHGVDSFAGRVASLFQGGSETTFYVLSVYAGAVGITRVRYALGCALLADAASLVLAVALGYAFFA